MSSDRLTALDTSFLHLEDAASHMHVASVMLFEGSPPPYDDLLDAIERRLHLVPRYRQRLAFVPLGQGRPKWVDDPHLNLRYHVRATALPAPGGDLAGVLAKHIDQLEAHRIAERLGHLRHALCLLRVHVRVDDRLAARLTGRALLLGRELQIDRHPFMYIDCIDSCQ
jgi:Wax ester synthase-like Acyl-CoA acyltransferase domain